MNDEINWNEALRPGDMNRPLIAPREPKYDVEVSKIVGKPVAVNDPRLIKLVVKWKQKQEESDNRQDFYLHNPNFLVELRATFK